ncbi:MAG TPA: hypothetical protein VFR23_20825 [Jiangellaceae bacterium]|nr:hypothetical protein [Jiangellaceae bacterium]
MTWWIWLPLSVITYGIIGLALAKRDLPAAWQRAQREWGRFSSLEPARESAQAQYLLMLLFWPFMVPWWAVVDHTRNIVEMYDPRRIEEENRELKREIERLEREAGLR